MAHAHRIQGRYRRRRGGRPRRGAVVLELILSLPVWLILLMAVVEFGMILVNEQQVALASRVGAEKASETAGLSISTGDPVPAPVLDAIEHQLGSSCLSACAVILEHNVAISPPAVLISPPDPACNCQPPGTALPADRNFVRVTVCVPLSQLAPNLLKFVGFDITNCVIHHSTTFRYEL